MTSRVVITGASALTPIGNSWDAISKNLKDKKSGVKFMEEWTEIENMTSHIAAPVADFETPKHFTRKQLRTMGKVSILAAISSENALKQAGLLGSARLSDGKTGLSFGSTSGSMSDAVLFMDQVATKKTMKGISGSTFIRFMSHTCVANLSQLFKIQGRIVSTSSACTSGSQGIGFGYEAIKNGAQDIMICGGAEENYPTNTAVFESLYATSTRNDAPHTTPRPFDKDRDGLVVGEGSATLILESLDSAKKREAKIIAEIIGFATNGDGAHMVNPSKDGMLGVMNLAIENAAIDRDQIDYVNAHGTSTHIGDLAESKATAECFNRKIPISSLKSYTGHTLGACGAIEAYVTINQLNENWVAPTLNLDNIDPECGDLDYVTSPRELEQNIVMSNNFAFGGINTSLIFKKWQN